MSGMLIAVVLLSVARALTEEARELSGGVCRLLSAMAEAPAR